MAGRARERGGHGYGLACGPWGVGACCHGAAPPHENVGAKAVAPAGQGVCFGVPKRLRAGLQAVILKITRFNNVMIIHIIITLNKCR